MLFLSGGMPRSATTWAFNVTDRLLRGRGIRCEKLNANSAADVASALGRPIDGENLLVHFHDCPPELFAKLASPHVCMTYAFRDPRDVVVSQMRLHDVPLQAAAQMTANACRTLMALLPHARNLMFIPYYSAKEHPKAVIHQLALHMGFIVGQEEVDAIAEATSPEAHKAVMNEVAAHSEATIETGLRTIRFDPETLINDRHVQSGQTGRWRTELSEADATWLDGVFSEFIGKVLEPPVVSA